MNDYKKKWFYLAILSLIWGSSFILIKKGLVGLNSVQLASLRMIFAASVIYIYSYNSIKKIPKKTNSQNGWSFLFFKTEDPGEEQWWECLGCSKDPPRACIEAQRGISQAYGH